MAKRRVYEREDGKWGWQLVADNDNIIAIDGNQGYENEQDARTMADRIIGGGYADAKKVRRVRNPK
ncbi:DUF1508 domain-containing protein [Arthrobacter sp. ISL-65]|uniref:DUF1508 domain-containing protein n=1 Tax=Arthrobacter sp. ISL-65 TaxID=2819112 RepID=UPI001BE75B8B|nr:DUF1508 domain-containing protein [Arthrobacter sp. ISL-65]MBT2550883.1 DUF1508 domain-containing protein [Arthrobacter sp. ISL-65]